MTIEDPIWGQAGTYDAREDRQVIAAVFEAEGVISGMRVTQRGAGANYTVDIAAGQCVIFGDDQTSQGAYIGWVSVAENRTVAGPPASGSRVDLIVARVYDPSAGAGSVLEMRIEVVQGTPAASAPVAPSVPNSAIVLASVLCSAGSGSYGDASITDLRPAAIARGGTPYGVPFPYFGATLPSGYGWANGGVANRFSAFGLFRAIGTSCGAGDGSTVNGTLVTFNVPDMRGVTAVGMDSFGGASAAGRITVSGGGGSLNQLVGEQFHSLTISELPAHEHGAESGHTHAGPQGIQFAAMEPATSALYVNSGAVADHAGTDISYYGATGPSSGHTHGSIGGNAGHNTMQPSRLCSWIVRL